MHNPLPAPADLVIHVGLPTSLNLTKYLRTLQSVEFIFLHPIFTLESIISNTYKLSGLGKVHVGSKLIFKFDTTPLSIKTLIVSFSYPKADTMRS